MKRTYPFLLLTCSGWVTPVLLSCFFCSGKGYRPMNSSVQQHVSDAFLIRLHKGIYKWIKGFQTHFVRRSRSRWTWCSWSHQCLPGFLVLTSHTHWTWEMKRIAYSVRMESHQATDTPPGPTSPQGCWCFVEQRCVDCSIDAKPQYSCYQVLLPKVVERMCPRINIYPCITRCARGNSVWAPLALMDTSTEEKSPMITDPGKISRLSAHHFYQRWSLFFHFIHHSICDATSVSRSIAAEAQTTAPHWRRSCWGREAPGKARPGVTTETCRGTRHRHYF